MKHKISNACYFSIALLFSSYPALYGCARESSPTVPIRVGAYPGEISIRSWRELRDEKIIRQEYDYSCGAASLATLLHFYYQLDVTEQDVIRVAQKKEWLSFADIYNALDAFGMKGYALALSYEQLRNLKVPVILYIEHKRTPHFAVLRGIDDRIVWVADPANGNTKYPIDRFLDKWEVRDDEKLKGKILLILPKDKSKTTTSGDFFHIPRSKQTAQKN